MNPTSIEWTDVTWNPTTGCNKISAGCKHCYADRLAKRLKAMGNRRYTNGFDLTLHPDKLAEPFKWKGKRVFVNSMSDLFHDAVPFGFIQRVFWSMRDANQNQYQVLTKRADRLEESSHLISWPENVWMGVSVENQDVLWRIDCLRSTGAKIKFLSLEPLIGPLPNLDLTGIDWVIVGGESGPGARPMLAEWVRGIRDQCQAAKVSFFFKQWGGVKKKQTGRELDGRTWDEFPKHRAIKQTSQVESYLPNNPPALIR